MMRMGGRGVRLQRVKGERCGGGAPGPIAGSHQWNF